MDGDAELKRMRMRSWRRGTKEMDLILGPFADEILCELSPGDRARFDRLLDENDHDLYQWVTSRLPTDGAGTVAAGPADLSALLDRIASHAAGRLR